MSDTRLKTFRLENGPFDDGPDTIYVECIGQHIADYVGQAVDDFTSVNIEEVDDAPEEAIVYRTDERHTQKIDLQEARVR